MTHQDDLKRQAAQAALAFVVPDTVIGVGTGSTIKFFIDELAKIKNKITAAVSSSQATTDRMKPLGIPTLELNDVSELSVYIDGADEIDRYGNMIKGGGAALTGEKIVAQVAKKFVCIVDESKKVDVLGHRHALPVEVIPLARSAVARAIVKLGGNPEYRLGVKTDYGNVILDVIGLDLTDPATMEKTLNNIPGVVTNGLFALRKANVLLVASDKGIERVDF